MANNERIPVFAQKGNDSFRNSLFKILRNIWIDSAPPGEKRRSKDLARILDVREQAVSQWASGSDRREPPWWAIMMLCHLTDRSVELRPDSVRVVLNREVIH